jgi:hypothetical protein
MTKILKYLFIISQEISEYKSKILLPYNIFYEKILIIEQKL